MHTSLLVCGLWFCSFWGPAVETWTVYFTVGFWFVVFVDFGGRPLKSGLYISLLVFGLWFRLNPVLYTSLLVFGLWFCSFWGPAVETLTVYFTVGFWFVWGPGAANKNTVAIIPRAVK